MKPLLFVTGNVPAYRVGALACLHEHERLEVALFGGRSLHGGPDASDLLPFPARRASAAQLARLAASGRYRAVVVPTGGRLAPAASWAGARAGRVPLVLWASLWAHPRSAAHALSYLPLHRLYRSADAVVTYGPLVSAYVRARGARNVHVAPQSVDNGFWGAPGVTPASDSRLPAGGRMRFLFVGRPAPEKGLDVLLGAWRALRADAQVALVLVGAADAAVGSRVGPPATSLGPPAVSLGPLAPGRLREVYAGCHVLVVPSRATRTFREPWGLVVNEAMASGLPVIVSSNCGCAEDLVEAGCNGFLFDPLKQDELTDRMVAISKSRSSVVDAMGRRSSEIIAGFSPQHWAAEVARVVTVVLPA